MISAQDVFAQLPLTPEEIGKFKAGTATSEELRVMVEKLKAVAEAQESTMSPEKKLQVKALSKLIGMRMGGPMNTFSSAAMNPLLAAATMRPSLTTVNGANDNVLSSSSPPQVSWQESLLYAVQQGNVEAMNKIVEDEKLSPKALDALELKPEGDEDVNPLVHWAALEDRVEMLKYFHQKLQMRDRRNGKGETALMWAAVKGHVRAIHLLVADLGSELHAADDKGYSALHHAAQNGHTLCCAMLHRRGIPIDVRDNNGRTPLHWAAYKDQMACARWLLSHGAEIAAQDWEKCQPLHWATLKGHYEMVRMLVEVGGAPLSHVDVTGARPIELARAKSERLKTEAENANKNNNDASNSIMIDTFAGMRNDLNKISRFLEAREKMEEAMANPPPSSTRSSNASNSSQTSSGYKLPTLSMKIGSKMPHPSYFIYVVMAPIAWYQYWYYVLPATSHLLMTHFVFIICFWAKLACWLRLQLKDPGDFVLPKPSRDGTRRRGTGNARSTWGWRRGGFPQFATRRAENTEEDEKLPLVVSSPSALPSAASNHSNGTGVTHVLSVKPSYDERATKPNPALGNYALAHRTMYDRVLDEGLLVPVCVTCEIVKPIRAKHDKVTDVCVAKFDHFCPWMNACVGELNYREFFLTAVFATTAMWLWVYILVVYTSTLDPEASWITNLGKFPAFQLWAWSYCLTAVYGSMMTGQHIWLVYRNLSTNEMINGYRYRYLIEDGKRGSPFDRGFILNLAEVLGVVEPIRMDLEMYYARELSGGKPENIETLLERNSSSPWLKRKRGGMGGYHGHSHPHGEEDDAGGSHGHSHASASSYTSQLLGFLSSSSSSSSSGTGKSEEGGQQQQHHHGHSHEGEEGEGGGHNHSHA